MRFYLLLIAFVVLGLSGRISAEQLPPRHCVDVGPLPLDDNNFCGCTWGEVLVHGQAVPGIPITVSFDGQTEADTTRDTGQEDFPYYHVAAHKMGARAGDELLLTAVVAGETYTQTYRAYPDDDGEQRITIVVPDQGIWEAVSAPGYTRTVTIADSTVWAGGDEGVVSFDMTRSISTTHPLPKTYDITEAPNGDIWAVTTRGLYQYNGTAWQTHAFGVAGAYLSVVASDTTIWLGGTTNGTDSNVVAFDGVNWSTVGLFNSTGFVSGLARDDDGKLWAGTPTTGAYRQDGVGGWTHFQATDGVASNTIVLNGVAASDDTVWFSTGAYQSDGMQFGGLGAYTPTTSAWMTYTHAHGLPQQDAVNAPATLSALTLSPTGVPYVAGGDRVSYRYLPNWWVHYDASHGVPMGAIRELAIGSNEVWFVANAGMYRLNGSADVGTVPTATIGTVEFRPTRFYIAGNGGDSDEAVGRIVNWEWVIVETGEMVCNSAECNIPYDKFDLPNGTFTLALRTQDDEGMWSEAATEQIQNMVPTMVKLVNNSTQSFENAQFFAMWLIVLLGFLLTTLVWQKGK